MADTTNRSSLDILKEKIADLGSSNGRVAPQLSDAILNMLTAVDDADEALLKSSLHSVLVSLTEVARDIIQRELKSADNVVAGIKSSWRDYVDGTPGESFDELKNLIESLLDDRIADMSRIRDQLVKRLEERDYLVPNAQQLEEGIRSLRQFRENILKDWPSPDKPLAPINRKVIDEVRAAFAQGDKGLRKDELVWGHDPSQRSN